VQNVCSMNAKKSAVLRPHFLRREDSTHLYCPCSLTSQACSFLLFPCTCHQASASLPLTPLPLYSQHREPLLKPHQGPGP
jgi:hypothetical protein